jgi:hypothetical protein
MKKGCWVRPVCLDSARDILYYIQDNQICKVGLDGAIQVLIQVLNGKPLLL